MLSKNQIHDVCLVGKDSKTCRYLSTDGKSDAFYCLKKTSKKQLIDIEVKDFIIFCEKKQIDPNDFHLPMADNCHGYTLLKNIEQGYDIKD